MKVLSLTQPWATLVAIGAKRYETRSWSTPHRGPLAIAASKSFPEECRRLCVGNPPFSQVLYDAGYTKLRDLLDECGHIIAVVDLVDVVRVHGQVPTMPRITPGPSAVEPGPHEHAFGDYTAGRFAWLTRNVRLIMPVPAKGRLGLWDFDVPMEPRP